MELRLGLVLSTVVAVAIAVSRPPDMIAMSGKEIYYKVGESIEMLCLSSGEPRPIYAWEKNEKEFDPAGNDDRIVQLANQGTIVFNRPDDRDEGIFQCFARNNYGIAASVKYNMRMAVLDDFPTAKETVYRVHRGEGKTLNCVPPTSLPPAEVYWVITDSLTGNYLVVKYDQRITMDHEGRLHITNVQVQDAQAGNAFACNAMNTVMRSNVRAAGYRIIPTGSTDTKFPPSAMWTSPTDYQILQGEDYKMKCIFAGKLKILKLEDLTFCGLYKRSTRPEETASLNTSESGDASMVDPTPIQTMASQNDISTDSTVADPTPVLALASGNDISTDSTVVDPTPVLALASGNDISTDSTVVDPTPVLALASRYDISTDSTVVDPTPVLALASRYDISTDSTVADPTPVQNLAPHNGITTDSTVADPSPVLALASRYDISTDSTVVDPTPVLALASRNDISTDSTVTDPTPVQNLAPHNDISTDSTVADPSPVLALASRYDISTDSTVADPTTVLALASRYDISTNSTVADPTPVQNLAPHNDITTDSTVADPSPVLALASRYDISTDSTVVDPTPVLALAYRNDISTDSTVADLSEDFPASACLVSVPPTPPGHCGVSAVNTANKDCLNDVLQNSTVDANPDLNGEDLMSHSDTLSVYQDSDTEYAPSDYVSDDSDSSNGSQGYLACSFPALQKINLKRAPEATVSSSKDKLSLPKSQGDVLVDKIPLNRAQESTVSSRKAEQSVAITEGDALVKVMSTNSDKKYDKKFFCLYCSKSQAKIPRHLLTVHKDEDDVKKYGLLSDKTEKDIMMTKLRNLGNHKHNSEVLRKQEGTIVVVYRHGGFASPANYVPCQYCLGYYVSWDLWKHVKRCLCAPRDRVKHARVVDAGRMLLATSKETSKGLKCLLSSMKIDEIGLAVKNDPLILQLGEKLFMKHGHDREKFNSVRNTLREAGRLLLKLRELKGYADSGLVRFIDPTLFQEVVASARSVAGFCFETHKFATPSLALKLGHTLRKCARIIEGNALQSGDEEKANMAVRFNKVCELSWSEEITTHALLTLSEQQRNKVKLIPLVKDVTLLANYLKNRGNSAFKLLSVHGDDVESWMKLNDVALIQIILFNRRRQGEVSKATVEDYSKLHSTAQDDINTSLSSLEQKLCLLFKRIEIVGKRGRTVPMIITPRVKSWIDLLLATRENAGVQKENLFLFPRCHYGSLGHIRGSDGLRDASESCGAKYPQLLRSTKLRKQIATLSQVLNLQENELDILANFLGHDIRVHRQYYRLPEETIQVAKVSKLLLAMENGQFSQYQGKSLDQITVDLDEDVDVALADCPESDSGETDEEQDEPPKKKKKLQSKESTEEESVSEAVEDQRLNSGCRVKRPWTEEEKVAVMRHFENHIFMRRLPVKREVDRCLNKERSLRKRTWKNIKDFVRNKIKPKPMI